MAEKTKKIRWVLPAVLFVLILSVSFGLMWSRGEDPLFAEAAKGLAAARIKGAYVIGPLSWAEYREQNGYEYEDNHREWRDINSSIPEGVKRKRFKDLATEESLRSRFETARPWYEGLQARVGGLAVHHPDPSAPLNEHKSLDVSQISKSLPIAIVASADAGDAAGAAGYARTMGQLSSKLLAEPATHSLLTAHWIRWELIQVAGVAAMRNRANTALAGELADSLEALEAFPPLADISAGDFRSSRAYLFENMDIRPDLIQRYLWERNTRPQDNSWLAAANRGEDVDSHSSERLMQEIFDRIDTRIRGKSLHKNRQLIRTGPNTAKAFEARAYETKVENMLLLHAVSTGGPAAMQKLRDFESDLSSNPDPSYVLAKEAVLGVTIANDYLTGICFLEAGKASLRMIQRYPDPEDLPDALPEDLVTPDPFMPGSSLVYRKTALGFMLYSVGSDGDDDGMPVNDLTRESYFTLRYSGNRGGDYGIAVNYNPVAPK
jgi:hypothetical protein